MEEEPKPSIGRIVHYQAFGTPGGEYKAEPRAAIITSVHPDSESSEVGLAVLNPAGLFFNPRVKYSSPPSPGCWNWPPRV